MKHPSWKVVFDLGVDGVSALNEISNFAAGLPGASRGTKSASTLWLNTTRWKDQAATVMSTVYLREAYPFGERTRYPYRCWLKVRREFLVEHFRIQEVPVGPVAPVRDFMQP
jgi:hypothetical protein